MISTLAAALKPEDVTAVLLGLAALLGVARLLGETVRRFGQPAVLGELLAGILLGETILGAVAPGAQDFLFPSEGAPWVALHALIMISATLLLLVAGLEVELSTAIRQGKAAVLVAFVGMALPGGAGFAVGWFVPEALGVPDPPHQLAFALFCAIALSITALPVIAKILIDLNIFKSDMGMLIMSAAMLNDMAGWMGFAVVMALIAPAVSAGGELSILTGLSASAEALPGILAAAEPGGGAAGVGRILLMTLGFLLVVMTLGRWAFHRALPLIQAYWSWPGGTLGVVLVLTLLCAAITEWIGVHAIFGAFIAGVAIGDSHHLRERTRTVVEQFIMNIFAPLFFASVGLSVNFVSAFNPIAVGVALFIAFTGKTTGCFLGARMAGFAPRESAAIGFGMVAQGTMGVILGQLALEAELINDEMFVAIVMVALATSIAAGPGMQKALRQKQARGLGDYLTEKRYVPDLKALTSQQAIDELCTAAAESNGLDQARVFAAVWRREQIMHTGLGNGVAVPHARLDEIKEPVLVIGRSAGGIDFDASDGKPAHIICLLLTPGGDHTAQVELLRLVAESFGNRQSMQEAMEAKSFTEFLVAIKLKGEE